MYTSQLLELLTDINESDKFPPSLQHDLSSGPPSPSNVPSLAPDDDTSEEPSNLSEAQAALEEARQDLRSGQISEDEFAQTSASLLAIIQRARSLTVLSKVLHSTATGAQALSDIVIPSDITEPLPAGYLEPFHGEEYITAVEGFLDARNTSEDGNAGPPYIPPRQQPSDKEKERVYQLQNPMSVYNWLNKHKQDHDDVFIDQTEDQVHTASKERATKTSSAGGAGSSSRRAASPKPPPQPTRMMKRERTSTGAAAAAAQQELLMEEMLDDEGAVISSAHVADSFDGMKKRKRAQKDDDAYRPKGGSSRPTKRKRASTGGAVAGGRRHEKRNSTASLGPGDAMEELIA